MNRVPFIALLFLLACLSGCAYIGPGEPVEVTRQEAHGYTILLAEAWHTTYYPPHRAKIQRARGIVLHAMDEADKAGSDTIRFEPLEAVFVLTTMNDFVPPLDPQLDPR